MPDKLYYKIGEVADVAGVKTSVLRFWESEFSFIRPEKSSSGQRLYTKSEVEHVLTVKRLLYDEKLTIEGAKKRLRLKGKPSNCDDAGQQMLSDIREAGLLQEIRRELQELRALL